jgi:hypothetical protein
MGKNFGQTRGRLLIERRPLALKPGHADGDLPVLFAGIDRRYRRRFAIRICSRVPRPARRGIGTAARSATTTTDRRLGGRCSIVSRRQGKAWLHEIGWRDTRLRHAWLSLRQNDGRLSNDRLRQQFAGVIRLVACRTIGRGTIRHGTIGSHAIRSAVDGDFLRRDVRPCGWMTIAIRRRGILSLSVLALAVLALAVLALSIVTGTILALSVPRLPVLQLPVGTLAILSLAILSLIVSTGSTLKPARAATLAIARLISA